MTNEEEIKECTLSHMNSIMTVDTSSPFGDYSAISKMGAGLGMYMGSISQVRIFNHAISNPWLNLMHDEIFSTNKPYSVIKNFPFDVKKTKDKDDTETNYYHGKKYFDNRLEAETFRLTSLISYYERKVRDTRKSSHCYKQGYKQKTYMFSFRDVSIMEKYITKYKRELDRLEIDHPEWLI